MKITTIGSNKRMSVEPTGRSRVMRAIGSKNTKPELVVRKELTRLGFHFRIHRKDLPGSPDIAFIGKKRAILIHGCFWHQHGDARCQLRKVPRTNLGYWIPKFARNVERDAENLRELKLAGWKALVIWECQLRSPRKLAARLQKFLSA